jgi:hypothetical protein
MPFKIYIEIEDAEDTPAKEFPGFTLQSRTITRQFDTLKEALDFGIGPNGFRRTAKSFPRGTLWTFRWFEVDAEGYYSKQLENVRNFCCYEPMPDGLIKSDPSDFPLDRLTIMDDKSQMELRHPEWWGKS